MQNQPVPSPCTKDCVLENKPQGLVCRGCKRTLDEIKDWYKMTDSQRQAVLRRLADVVLIQER